MSRDPFQHLRKLHGDAFVRSMQQRNGLVAGTMLGQMQAAKRPMPQQTQQMIGSLPRGSAGFDPFERPTIIDTEGLGDDFGRLVNQIGEAFALPDGTTASELHALARLRNEQEEEADKGLVRAIINPPSARKGVLGGAVDVLCGSAAQRVINWSADRFEEACPLTISLGVVTEDIFGTFDTSGAQNRPYANLYWLGGRGVPMNAQVDIGKGCQFTIGGSFVAVDLGLDKGNGIPGGQMSLGAWLSFFPTMKTTPATRTAYIDGLANGGGIATVKIPSFASSLLPLQVTDATPNILIEVLDVLGMVISAASLLLPGAQVAPLPLANDAYQIRFTNTGAAPTTNMRAIFALSF